MLRLINMLLCEVILLFLFLVCYHCTLNLQLLFGNGSKVVFDRTSIERRIKLLIYSSYASLIHRLLSLHLLDPHEQVVFLVQEVVLHLSHLLTQVQDTVIQLLVLFVKKLEILMHYVFTAFRSTQRMVMLTLMWWRID